MKVNNQKIVRKIKNTFIERFGNDPILIKSPGRVNLIGEHTDYNNGFVLTASINKAIYFAVKPNNLGQFRFFAIDLNEQYSTLVDQIEKCKQHWANYLLGVIAQFVKDGKTIEGFDCVFGGDIPLGAGMSSSAAIECGIAFAINHLHKFDYSSLQLVKFAQIAEHEYAGVQCGIMDQFASMHGKANHVIKLDCRSLDYDLFPFDMKHYLLILVNTGVKHSLASSEYNIRRQECEEGVMTLQQHYPEIKSLRDANMDVLNKHETEFSPTVYKRCSYIIQENQRVELACITLQSEDFNEFGQLMYSSHKGLKDQYEVSCNELDKLVDIAKDIDGVMGARMMGGGFGGCTINLVKEDSVTKFEKTIKEHYITPDGGEPQIIKVVIGDGTSMVNDV